MVVDRFSDKIVENPKLNVNPQLRSGMEGVVASPRALVGGADGAEEPASAARQRKGPGEGNGCRDQQGRAEWAGKGRRLM
jgi:hypothetical protein